MAEASADCLEKNEAKDETSNESDSKDEKFTLFWHKESPFSQHHPSVFTVDGVKYNCAEQFMMHQKAVQFGDTKSADEIMKAPSPHRQKALGRKVKGYNEELWNKICKNVVRKGSEAKYTQNADLKAELLKTAGTTLVEASPHDRKWGIGLGPNDPKALDRKTWRGTNLLGQILTEVRDELLAEVHDELVAEEKA